MNNLEAGIHQAVARYLPGRSVCAIKDRGEWVRRIVEVTLDGDEVVFFKLHTHEEWFDSTEEERETIDLFHAHGLPAPVLLATDTSRELLPHPYVIQEAVGGARMSEVLRHADEPTSLAIYETVGQLYARMHAVHNDWAGIWADIPNKPHPSAYLYRAEIVEGSGKQAREAGQISRAGYKRAVALWGANLEYLQDHQPALVHYSAFPWTVHLEQEAASAWRVSHLTSLGDILWWDGAWDATCLLYPPFGETTASQRAAFLRGYGPAPERKRCLLYLVLQRLCAVSGCYLAPATPEHHAWAAHALNDFGQLLDEIEAVT